METEIIIQLALIASLSGYISTQIVEILKAIPIIERNKKTCPTAVFVAAKIVSGVTAYYYTFSFASTYLPYVKWIMVFAVIGGEIIYEKFMDGKGKGETSPAPAPEVDTEYKEDAAKK